MSLYTVPLQNAVLINNRVRPRQRLDVLPRGMLARRCAREASHDHRHLGGDALPKQRRLDFYWVAYDSKSLNQSIGAMVQKNGTCRRHDGLLQERRARVRARGNELPTVICRGMEGHPSCDTYVPNPAAKQGCTQAGPVEDRAGRSELRVRVEPDRWRPPWLGPHAGA